jgi:hypothetical protein
MIRSKMLVSGTAVLLACGLSAGAQGSSQGKGKDKPTTSSGATVAGSIHIEIGSRDRETITKYYTANPAGLPPGLAKRGGDLPPGLDKQLRRNGSLPPGLQKKLEPFPATLERQVMKLPSGYNWFVLGAHIVVVNKQTNLVGDFALNIVK